jgi:hypothetical protein
MSAFRYLGESSEVAFIPHLAHFRVEVHIPQNEINPSHLIPEILRVGEDVGALLVIHARYAITVQEVRKGKQPEGAVGVSNRRLAWSRRASGVVGSVMVLHAFGTSTSRIARRVTFFRLDLDPSVATSLVKVSDDIIALRF